MSGSHSVAQAGLELKILLPRLSSAGTSGMCQYIQHHGYFLCDKMSI
jgi:hypothetical protein